MIKTIGRLLNSVCGVRVKWSRDVCFAGCAYYFSYIKVIWQTSVQKPRKG